MTQDRAQRVRRQMALGKADERQVLPGILDADPDLLAQRPGQTLTGDKNYHGRR
jgi:hypothetical protein